MTTASTLHSRHAERMDRLYRYQRHIYDVTRKYYLFGRDRLIAELNVPGGGRVLEIGCGTGRNLVVAARRNPQGLFYGIDISREMLRSAECAAQRAGVANRVFLRAGDAESCDAAAGFGVKGFERVFFSYCLSMVPEWERAMETAPSQVAPGGSLHFVDFGRMEAWPAFAREGIRRWLAQFHVTPREALVEEANKLAEAKNLKVQTASVAGGYASIIVLSRAAA